MTNPDEGNPSEVLDGEIPPLREAVPDGSLLCRRFRIQGGLGTPGTIAFSLKATDLLTNEEVVCKSASGVRRSSKTCWNNTGL